MTNKEWNRDSLKQGARRWQECIFGVHGGSETFWKRENNERVGLENMSIVLVGGQFGWEENKEA